MISDGIEQGAFRPVHAAFTAEAVAATMVGIQQGDMLHRLKMTDSAAYAELAELVVIVSGRGGIDLSVNRGEVNWDP